MGTQRLDFAEFYRESKDACLFSVLVSVHDRPGMRRALKGPGQGGTWAPPPLGGCGAALIAAGVLVANPMNGFPPAHKSARLRTCPGTAPGTWPPGQPASCA